MNKVDSSRYAIKSVERAFEIVDLLCRRQAPVSNSEVARELGINSNMSYRLLMTLCRTGYLRQIESETVRFGFTLKVLQTGIVALDRLEIRLRSVPFLQALWSRFRSANVNLAVFENGKVIQVVRIDSERFPRTSSIPGRVLPIHATALGKILVSELDSLELHKYLGPEPFIKYTENTIDTYEKLKKELERVRNEGVAWDNGEEIPGDHCVATAIRNKNRSVVGAISFSALEIHVTPKELKEYTIPLIETARSISESLGISFTGNHSFNHTLCNKE
jgi:IclR family KDG regulon transcriptional repressor